MLSLDTPLRRPGLRRLAVLLGLIVAVAGCADSTSTSPTTLADALSTSTAAPSTTTAAPSTTTTVAAPPTTAGTPPTTQPAGDLPDDVLALARACDEALGSGTTLTAVTESDGLDRLGVAVDLCDATAVPADLPLVEGTSAYAVIDGLVTLTLDLQSSYIEVDASGALGPASVERLALDIERFHAAVAALGD